MTDIIYSGTKIRDRGNRVQKNPKFFTALPDGVSRVIVDGSLDPQGSNKAIIEAANKAGVEVVAYKPGMFGESGGGVAEPKPAAKRGS